MNNKTIDILKLIEPDIKNNLQFHLLKQKVNKNNIHFKVCKSNEHNTDFLVCATYYKRTF